MRTPLYSGHSFWSHVSPMGRFHSTFSVHAFRGHWVEENECLNFVLAHRKYEAKRAWRKHYHCRTLFGELALWCTLLNWVVLRRAHPCNCVAEYICLCFVSSLPNIFLGCCKPGMLRNGTGPVSMWYAPPSPKSVLIHNVKRWAPGSHERGQSHGKPKVLMTSVPIPFLSWALQVFQHFYIHFWHAIHNIISSQDCTP